MTSSFRFTLLHQSTKSRARVGRIDTPHGPIDTPNFVAVGTNGTVKAIDSQRLESLQLQLLFCNTYHLLLQPGTEVVQAAGGLHRFMGRSFPIITDSGGFQVFSLKYGSVAEELKGKGKKQEGGSVIKITEEGVLFRSYRDGTKIWLTAESSIQAQKELGADIIIPFDELPPYHFSEQDLKVSLERTHRWEIRSLRAHQKNTNGQAIYGVIHGGTHEDLRQKSCHVLTKEEFDGFAIGGSMGKTKDQMFQLLSFTLPLLPEEKPNHLLGIGDLFSIEQCIPLGIDTFDSSYPTRSARHGIVFTKNGPLNLTKVAYRKDTRPIEESCTCPTCRYFSLSYLQHLFKAKELAALSLASIHNLSFMVRLMQEYRNRIWEDRI